MNNDFWKHPRMRAGCQENQPFEKNLHWDVILENYSNLMSVSKDLWWAPQPIAIPFLTAGIYKFSECLTSLSFGFIDSKTFVSVWTWRNVLALTPQMKSFALCWSANLKQSLPTSSEVPKTKLLVTCRLLGFQTCSHPPSGAGSHGF